MPHPDQVLLQTRPAHTLPARQRHFTEAAHPDTPTVLTCLLTGMSGDETAGPADRARANEEPTRMLHDQAAEPPRRTEP